MHIAVLGASGLVGRTMVQCLAAQSWVDEPPLLLCSSHSAGQQVPFREQVLSCHDAALHDCSNVELALFSAGAAASRLYGPLFSEAGAWVVDNSSAFRMTAGVPLVVPEVNAALVPALGSDAAAGGGIIANPNCSTIQIVVPLAALDQAFGLREAHVTTLQSVSGAGQRAVDELQRQARGAVAQETGSADVASEAATSGLFPRFIAANVIPAIGTAMPDGSFEEEDKVVRETRKILDRPGLAVSCTATRVPVLRGHGAAVRVILSRKVTPAEAAEALTRWPGMVVDPDPHGYRTPLEIAGLNPIHVGRLRADPCRDDALLFWVVADNLLKGAAWNAVQIVELLAGV
ncbi:MAG: aspartate-semialdehyde dehydrogenase [bacterium]